MNVAVFSGGIATIAWILAIIVVVAVVVQSGRGRPIKRGATVIIIMIAASILFSTVSAGLVFINPDERGVVISAISPQGYRSEPLEPGLRWIVPFAESVIIYPISKQTYTMSIATEEGQIQGDDSIEARTSDGQKVLIDASVIFSIDPAEVVNVHITWQDRYSNDLVRAVSRGVIRDAVSKFGIEDVYSLKRDEMVTIIHDEMEKKMKENGLILVDFVLRNISFSDEYAASVEQKQIAEQQAQQAKFVVEQKKQEAQQAREVALGKKDAAITEAEGNAEARKIEAAAEAASLQMVSDVLNTNPYLLSYQYITKLTPDIDVMLLPNDSPFIIPLPEFQSSSSVTSYLPTAVPTPVEPAADTTDATETTGE